MWGGYVAEYPQGLSAQAIAGHGIHHPYDPSDLNRCRRYIDENGISTTELQRRMESKSPTWARLLVEWDALCELLQREMDGRTDGMAPLTYRAMVRIRANGVKCPACSGTGNAGPCPKCKGTGRRGGGRCRAQECDLGALPCRSCLGRGYTKGDF